MFRKSIVCMILFFVGFTVLHAQENNTKEVLDKSYWEKLSKDLDYPTEVLYERENNISPPDVSFTWLKYFFFGIIVIALGYLIYLIAKNMEPSSKRLSKASLYDFDTLDEDIHEADLEAVLRKAIENNLYNLAIRVHFLIVIKTLSESGEILWKADKTNRAYLKEMKAHSDYKKFYQLTRLYEKIWFGNEELSELLYGKVAPVYQQFNQTLSRDEK